MHAMLSSGELDVVNENVFFELWHMRLGHMSQNGLDVLIRKNITFNAIGTCILFYLLNNTWVRYLITE